MIDSNKLKISSNQIISVLLPFKRPKSVQRLMNLVSQYQATQRIIDIEVGGGAGSSFSVKVI